MCLESRSAASNERSEDDVRSPEVQVTDSSEEGKEQNKDHESKPSYSKVSLCLVKKKSPPVILFLFLKMILSVCYLSGLILIFFLLCTRTWSCSF